MLFEGEIDEKIKEEKSRKKTSYKKNILKIKIETDRYEYEIDLSYKKKYLFFFPLIFVIFIFVFDWLKLRINNSSFDAVYSTFYESSPDGLARKVSELKKEIKKLKDMNEALVSLVFGGDQVYPEIISADFEGDYILQNISIVSESLKMIYDELQKEKESFEHLPTLWPVKGRITSGFGYRVNPVDGEYQFHSGIDISAPEGTPVLSSASGKVVEVAANHLNGLYVRIRHINGIYTTYAHLRKVFVSKGDYVKKGEIIGLVGSTGRATGKHLHFEISFRGRPIDPTMLLVQD
ncbi:MAG: M23 family metallopeptidase [Candidatus Calescibacterium sp.]|nr:M23 family metallopeptidase [Candidatus Calescibacterium sp.]MCX7733380.1 M23 family metallopeptidase [bacterium]